jgi:hypothetical protein
MIRSLRLCRVRQPNNCDFLSVHYGVPSRLHGDQKPSFSFEKVAKQTQILAHNQHDDGVSATDDVIPGPHRPLLKLFRVSWVPIFRGFHPWGRSISSSMHTTWPDEEVHFSWFSCDVVKWQIPGGPTRCLRNLGMKVHICTRYSLLRYCGHVLRGWALYLICMWRESSGGGREEFVPA